MVYVLFYSSELGKTIFFLTGKKSWLFGIRCKSVGQSVKGIYLKKNDFFYQNSLYPPLKEMKKIKKFISIRPFQL